MYKQVAFSLFDDSNVLIEVLNLMGLTSSRSMFLRLPKEELTADLAIVYMYVTLVL